MNKICCLLLLIIGAPAHSQDANAELVRQGRNAFYQAEFEEAQGIMARVLSVPRLTTAERYEAHLYTAFSLIRLNGHPDSIRYHLARAMTIDPARELDANLIPPDLYEQYALVKASTMGGMRIHTHPVQAVAIFHDRRTGKSISMNTPAAFLNLAAGEYDLLLQAPGRQDVQTIIQVQPGRTDSLTFELIRLTKPWYKTWWAWSSGGACAVLAWLVFSDQDENGKAANNDLPMPPSRP